jgi:enterobacteria phage integrase
MPAVAHEIMAALGHATLAEAERYTRAKPIADGADEMLSSSWRHTRRTGLPQTTPAGLGIVSKIEGGSK